jgi:hypothetical protein
MAMAVRFEIHPRPLYRFGFPFVLPKGLGNRAIELKDLNKHYSTKEHPEKPS